MHSFISAASQRINFVNKLVDLTRPMSSLITRCVNNSVFYAGIFRRMQQLRMNFYKKSSYR